MGGSEPVYHGTIPGWDPASPGPGETLLIPRWDSIAGWPLTGDAVTKNASKP
jgi:hypothetical protein